MMPSPVEQLREVQKSIRCCLVYLACALLGMLITALLVAGCVEVRK